MACGRAGRPEGGRRVWGFGATSVAGSRSCSPPSNGTQRRRQAKGFVAPAECDTPTDFRDTRRIVGPSCVMMRQHEPEPVPSGLRVHRAAHASARTGRMMMGGREDAEHNRAHFS